MPPLFSSRTSIGISSSGRSDRQALLGSWQRQDGAPIRPIPAPRRVIRAWTDRLRLILISALQVDRAIFFSTAIIVAAFIPLFTMQGVEGQIFSPMARTYAYALVGALLATFTVTPCLASLLLPGACRRGRNLRRAHHTLRLHAGAALVAAPTQGHHCDRCRLPRFQLLPRLAARQRIPADARRRQSVDSRHRCRRPYRWKPACRIVNKIREILLRHPEVVTVVSQHGRPDNGSDAAGFFNAEFFVPLKPFEEWPTGCTKEKLIEDLQPGVRQRIRRYRLQFLAVHPGQCRRRPVRR